MKPRAEVLVSFFILTWIMLATAGLLRGIKELRCPRITKVGVDLNGNTRSICEERK